MGPGLVVLLAGLGLASVHEPSADLLARRTPACPRPLPGLEAPPRRGLELLSPVLVDSVIKDDFPCNDDSCGGTQQRSPSIAVDSAGGFVVAWYEFRDGDADVWYQRFDADGDPIGANERINSDASMGWQGDPAAAVAKGGDFLFSWEDRREIGNSDLFCQRFDAAGERKGDNFRVSDSGVAGDQDLSGASTNPAGLTLVAWDDRRFGLTGDIFGQFLNPDGSRLDTNFRVNDDPVGYANQYQPRVSGDDSGGFVVAWMDGRGLNAYDWNVFCQRFDGLGNRLGSNIQVTTNDSIQWSPGLAVAPAGHFVVCWEDRRTGAQSDVYAQWYDADACPVGGNMRVNDDPGGADQSSAAAAANPFGEFLLVWTDQRNGNEDIYGQLYTSTGQAVGDNFRVSDGPGDKSQHSPAAARMEDGGYLVVWCDSRSGDPDIYCRPFSREGQPLGAGFRVNDDSASSHQRVSSIGMDSRGVSMVAWEDERNGETDIYCCLFGPDGTPLGPNLLINDDGVDTVVQCYAAVAAGSGCYLVVWTDARTGFDIYGQFLNADGHPIGANQRVNSDTADAFQWYPFCALDTANRAAVVWMDRRDGPYRIMARLYGQGHSPAGPEFTVSDSTGNEYYASVAKSRPGRFVVSWMDDRGSDMNIYCQLFSQTGTKIGDNVRVNDDPGTAYQGYPGCAMADDGSFVVAWEDTRNDGYDVYLQWFDSTGQRIGPNERVNDGPEWAESYSATCAYDRAGRLAVAFDDDRDRAGSPKLYCQRFRPDRSRIGHNQQFSDPELFAKNHHWTVGQSVAVSDEVVACAWTDNRRHRGWDTYAKVTDWDLVGVASTSLPAFTAPDWIRPTVSVAGSFQIELELTQLPARLLLVDPAGRLIRSRVVEENAVLLDAAGIAEGVYFALLETRSSRLVGKLVVSRGR